MSVTPTHVKDKSKAEASDLWSNNLLLFYVRCKLFWSVFRPQETLHNLFKKKLDPVLHYACCITPMRVMSFWRQSLRHCACRQHSFFEENIAAVASRW